MNDYTLTDNQGITWTCSVKPAASGSGSQVPATIDSKTGSKESRGANISSTCTITSNTSFDNVASIVLHLSASKSQKYSVGVTVGGKSIGSTQNLTQTNHKNYSYSNSDGTPLSGVIEITITKLVTTQAGSIWIAGAMVTTSDGKSSLTDFSWSASSANPFLDNTSYVFPTLTAFYSEGNAVESSLISYSSSDDKVATIDTDGKVTLVGAGEATIKASYAGSDTYQAAEATYSLEVRLHTASKFLFVDADKNEVKEVNIVVGSDEDDYTLPTLYNSADMTVKYSSSDENIALVDASGYIVETSKKGSTTITAKGTRYAYNDAEASYVINITAKTPEISFSKSEVEFDMGTQDEFYEPTLTTNSTGKVTYASSNTSVATVDATSGEVTIKGKGTAIITATVAEADIYSSNLTSYTLNVTSSVTVGGDYTLVTSTDELQDGDEILFVGHYTTNSSSKWTAITATQKSSSNTPYYYRGNVTLSDVTSLSTSISAPEKATPFILGKTDNGWTFYDSSEGAYMSSPTETNNGAIVMMESVSIAGNSESSITIDESSVATVTYKEGGLKVFCYNGGSNRYACYNGAVSPVQNSLYIYRKGNANSTQTVTIGTKGISSFCSKNALDFTDATIKAWKATSVEGTTVKLEQVYKVPAKTGILVTGTEGDSEEIPILSEEPDAISGNMLEPAFKGSTIKHSDNGTYNYVFGTKNSVKGFYKLVENDMESQGNYAYLQSTVDYLATDSSAKGLTFDFANDATGISSVGAAKAAGNAVYTISGQRVSKPTKAGLYIVNGRKIVVK